MDEPITDSGSEAPEQEKRTTRRQVKSKRGVTESGKKALEELARIKKDGGKREFEVREEAPIYSEVEEAEYRKLTEEKRSKIFVEDDDGLGYDDYGEDDLGFDAEDDDEDSTSGKKKKNADGSVVGKKRKRSQRKVETTVPSQRITDMFLNPKQPAEGKTPTKKLKTGVSKPDENTPIGDELEAIFADLKKNPLAPAAPVVISSQFKKVSEPAKVPFKEVDTNSSTTNTNVGDKANGVDKPATNGADKPKDSAAATNGTAAVKANGAPKIVNMADIDDEDDKGDNNAAKYQAEEEAEAAKYTGDDWFALKEKDQEAGSVVISQTVGATKSIEEIPKNANNEVLFYWLDAQDDLRGAPGVVYMFGKVLDPKTKQLTSCCVTVKGIERKIYVVPKQNSGEVDSEGNAIPCKVEDVQKEFLTVRNSHGNFEYKSRKVKKNYAFEIEDIPRKKDIEVLEVVYPYTAPELPSDLKGNTFSHILGQVPAIENFLIQRKLMGPAWLKLKNIKANTGAKSWCKFECSLDSPTHLELAYDNKLPIPPVTVCSLKVQTVVNQSTKVNEIISIGLLFKHNVDTQVPTPVDQTQKGTTEVVFLRKPQGHTLPLAFPKYLIEHKLEQSIVVKNTERDLLNAAMEMIGNVDPDILVGHNINGYDLDVMLHRMHDLQCVSWSKLGRLNQKNMPHMKKTGINNKGESNFTKRKVTIGRLVCDTYHSAKELIKSKDYTLSTLARTQLKTNRQSVNSDKMPSLFNTTEDLLYFCRLTTNDAFLTLKLMFKLNVLPLTKQLTQISGNLWYRSLTGARAERIEYLLLHEFFANEYLLPDKAKFEEHGEGFSKNKKKPAYEGGLVLEPKKGLYDKFILLLDFQSLYPSIIQEYNVCFTTVDRKKDPTDNKKWLLSEPPAKGVGNGILPQVIKTLVEKRRMAKDDLKAATDPNRKAQLEIQQLALKLVANSMYGCLGFTGSRFLAMPLAELVTRKGRENLQKTVDIATKKLGLEVIYGDTDSIMINTGLTNYAEVEALGRKIRSEVNHSNTREGGQKSQLEIEIDGIFKTMLLCKKKKYAAVRVRGSDDKTGIVEKKGLDLVRRDWCELSHEMGEYVLEKILNSSSKDEVVDNIHAYLRNTADDIRHNKIPLKKFAITKSLTKAPEDYKGDSKSQPHVQVALAMRKEGQSVRVGDVIPYIICKLPEGEDNKNKLLSERAFHPETVKKQNLEIDLEWYFTAQIYPPIARLIEPLEGTDNVLVAQCLGLDPTKFGIKLATNSSIDSNVALPSFTEDSVKYKSVDKLVLKCPSCSMDHEFLGVWHQPAEEDRSMSIFASTLCSNCKRPFSGAAISNAVTLATRKHIGRYYASPYLCDERTCGTKTREFNVKGDGRAACPRKGCNGTLFLEYDKSQLYTQLRYFQDLFDWRRISEKLDRREPKQQEEFFVITTSPANQLMRDAFDKVNENVTMLLQQNGYGVVDCAQLFGFFKL